MQCKVLVLTYACTVQYNKNMRALQIHGTCLGHQLLQILVANQSYVDLLVLTDSVVRFSVTFEPLLA